MIEKNYIVLVHGELLYSQRQNMAILIYTVEFSKILAAHFGPHLRGRHNSNLDLKLDLLSGSTRVHLVM